MTEPPVAIAGGGIAGLCAALAVAGSGRAVRVFERDPVPSQEGAGVQLSPNATRHLRTWGVLDRLERLALAPEAVVVRRARDADVVVAMDLTGAEERWGAPFRIAHRADLHAALRRVATARPDIRIHDGVGVSGYENNGTLRIQATDGRTHDAAALVVADGVRSVLRGRFEAPDDPRSCGRVAWRALVPAARCPSFACAAVSNLWLGPSAHLVHYPLRGGTVVNVVAVVTGPLTAGADTWSRPGDPADLVCHFAGWHRDARDLVAAADTWRVWPLLARPVPEHLAQGRVALVGDAAHPMMPFLAQGAAQAVEDAAALGRAFAETDEVTKALASYAQARRLRAKRIVSASERQARIYHLAGPAAFARDLAMRALGSGA